MPIYEKMVYMTAPLILFPSIFQSFFPGKIIIPSVVCMAPLLWFYLYDGLRRGSREIVCRAEIFLYNLFCFMILAIGSVTLESQQDYTVFYGSSIFSFVLFPAISRGVTIFRFMLYVRSYLICCIVAILLISVVNNGSVSMVSRGIFIPMLMIPYLKSRWRIVWILSIIVFSILADSGSRSLLANALFVVFILGSYYLFANKRLLVRFFKSIAIIFYISPLLFLILGVTCVFNIFQIGNHLDLNVMVGDNKKHDRNILVDSRTSIYRDVLGELNDRDAFIWGLGANGKTKTSLVSDATTVDYSEIYKEGRRGTESGMLNHIQYGGLFGFLAYYLLIIFASINAIWRSNNFYAIFLGMFCAFKLLFSFVEDRNSPDISYFFVMVLIGICYNSRFRRFSNSQMKQYINSI